MTSRAIAGLSEERWALVTGCSGGPYHQMLDMVRDHNRRYAENLGMDYIESNNILVSWDKVRVLFNMLDEYDGVMWMDVDAVCIGTDDIRIPLDDGAWGWVIHYVEGEGVPNCGVLVMRKQAQILLAAMLELRPQYEQHAWWEQAAAMKLCGWEPILRDSYWMGKSIFRTVELPYRFNIFPHAAMPVEGDPVIIHASGMGFNYRFDYLQRAIDGEQIWVSTS